MMWMIMMNKAGNLRIREADDNDDEYEMRSLNKCWFCALV
jgi:hypothetical protein